MFDIGFWEITLIAVIALLLVGPEEFPVLVRNVGRWFGRVRRYVVSIKDDLDQEINRAEEARRRLSEQVDLAEKYRRSDVADIERAVRRQDGPAAKDGGESSDPDDRDQSPHETSSR